MKTLSTKATVADGDLIVDATGRYYKLVRLTDQERQLRRKQALAALNYDTEGGLKIGGRTFQPVETPTADKAAETLKLAGLAGLDPQNQQYNRATGRYETKQKREETGQ